MDYRLATAMRGPDHATDEAGAWKLLVTAPLRWFAATLMKRRPNTWSNGSVSSPVQVYNNLTDSSILARALKFARSPASGHVKAHARDAFCYLARTSERAASNKLYKTLTEKGLL